MSDKVRIGQKLRMPVGKSHAVSAPQAQTASVISSGTASHVEPVRPAPTAAKPTPMPAQVVSKPVPVPAPVAVGPVAMSASVPPKAPPAISKPAAAAAAPAAEAVRPVAADAAPLLVHEVRADEDLVGIAMMYGVSVEAVKKANGLIGDTVKPGQKLKIP